MDAEESASVDESAELRMLRAKAYGRGEGLSAEELARLQELEGRSSGGEERFRLAETGTEGADLRGDHARGALSERSETKRAERPQGVEASETPGASIPPEASHPAPPETPRRRWPLLVAASAAILAVGLGIGWGIWGWDSNASALAAAHSDTQAEIESEQQYDAGTVVPIAEKYGVVVWRADRSEGEEICVIVTAPDQTSHGCVPYDDFEDSVWPNATAVVPEDQKKAGQQLVAGLISTQAGEVTSFIQVWDQDASAWESQYSDEELSQMRVIEDAGYEADMLNILGYDGPTAVWGSWEGGGFCVIAPTDGGVADACVENAEETITLEVIASGIRTRYVVAQAEGRAPQLTIYKDIDMEYYFGDTSIDDKTGE